MPDAKRWWQTWDDKTKRSNIQSFWKNDAQQPERREHFYAVLKKELSGLPSGIKLLDFGCGTGEDTAVMRSLGVDYAGADVTTQMLAQARRDHPGVQFDQDDMLASKYADRQWPVVVCNAVLPHLPTEGVVRAIRELWRITGKLLLVRLFGVDLEPESTTKVWDGFIYQRWTRASWEEHFRLHAEDAFFRVHQGHTDNTKDCLIFACLRS